MLYQVPQPEAPAIVQLLPPEKGISADNSPTQTPNKISRLTPQKSSAPDFSPFSAATSAALLGSPFSVGYRVQPTAEPISLGGMKAIADAEVPAVGERVSPVAEVTPVPNQRLDTRLLTKERSGKYREFRIQRAPVKGERLQERKSAPQQVALLQTPQTQTPRSGTPAESIPLGSGGGVVELTSDRQEYDAERQTITAEGNVMMRFQQAVLNADRIQVNLQNRMAIASGNVALRRGQQLLRGNRFEYNFVQDSGVILNASGEFYQPTAESDFSPTLPTDLGATALPAQTLSDRITANQPLQQLTNTGGIGIVVGSGRNIPNQSPLQQGGSINRLRFQSDRVDFEGNSLQATNVRITNDPFSPPELELRADTAQFTRVSPLQDEITANRPRLVLDQGFNVPLFRNRLVIDRSPRQPSPINFGYDRGERGGLFVDRTFALVNTPGVRFSITPQFFVQKAVEEGKYFDPDVFGLRARLNATISPRTALTGSGVLTSLDFNDLENELRGRLQLSQAIGTGLPHILSLNYGYRDRLFNGSLGFKTVHSSLGAVLTSPVISLGETGVNLSYQASAQLIDSETDRLDMLEPNRGSDRINLSRYQASASLSRGFVLLQGEALPATATEGLRYTPAPVVPYLQLNAGVTGVATGYSNGDTQNSISGNIGLQGQIGHFSRPFLDYTGFNITYSQIFPNGLSPFLFDR
ncbi:MAG TPA: DUF3769 domain-containing protein, partial [Candidatus Obscuribacterales bacterium]